MKMIRFGLKTTLFLTIGATIISCNLYGRKSARANVLLSESSKTEVKIQNVQSSDTTSSSTCYEIPALRKNSREIILHRKGYTVLYNPTTKLPNWVAWHLTAEHTSGMAKRKVIEFHVEI